VSPPRGPHSKSRSWNNVVFNGAGNKSTDCIFLIFITVLMSLLRWSKLLVYYNGYSLVWIRPWNQIPEPNLLLV
jgi:hypothetical protein